MEERFIERNSVAEFCEALRKNNAEFKGHFKRTFWDGDSEKGFIVKLSINEVVLRTTSLRQKKLTEQLDLESLKFFLKKLLTISQLAAL